MEQINVINNELINNECVRDKLDRLFEKILRMVLKRKFNYLKLKKDFLAILDEWQNISKDIDWKRNKNLLTDGKLKICDCIDCVGCPVVYYFLPNSNKLYRIHLKDWYRKDYCLSMEYHIDYLLKREILCILKFFMNILQLIEV